MVRRDRPGATIGTASQSEDESQPPWLARLENGLWPTGDGIASFYPSQWFGGVVVLVRRRSAGWEHRSGYVAYTALASKLEDRSEPGTPRCRQADKR